MRATMNLLSITSPLLLVDGPALPSVKTAICLSGGPKRPRYCKVNSRRLGLRRLDRRQPRRCLGAPARLPRARPQLLRGGTCGGGGGSAAAAGGGSTKRQGSRPGVDSPRDAVEVRHAQHRHPVARVGALVLARRATGRAAAVGSPSESTAGRWPAGAAAPPPPKPSSGPAVVPEGDHATTMPRTISRVFCRVPPFIGASSPAEPRARGSSGGAGTGAASGSSSASRANRVESDRSIRSSWPLGAVDHRDLVDGEEGVRGLEQGDELAQLGVGPLRPRRRTSA